MPTPNGLPHIVVKRDKGYICLGCGMEFDSRKEGNKHEGGGE